MDMEEEERDPDPLDLDGKDKHLWRNSWGSPKCSQEQRKNEWKCVSKCSLGFKRKLSDFKSQSLPWMKWCPANYQVQKGNHLLCCPLPTMLDGLVPPLQEEVWFSQSRSSRLWPVPYCREQITRSCQSPAEIKTDNGRNKNTGKNY